MSTKAELEEENKALKERVAELEEAAENAEVTDPNPEDGNMSKQREDDDTLHGSVDGLKPVV